MSRSLATGTGLAVGFLTLALAASGPGNTSAPAPPGASKPTVAKPGSRPADSGDLRVLSTIKKGTELEGFRAEAVYLNDAGAPMGGRFVHGRSGFVLDLLTIETAPQAFTWVRSFPVGDQGEPHTQEH